MRIYNKLVRDNIPEIMIANGAKPVIRVLNEEEYLTELNKKILEEVEEYLESGSLEELADILEVMLAIVSSKGASLEELEHIRTQKVLKRGAFEKRLFLERED